MKRVKSISLTVIFILSSIFLVGNKPIGCQKCYEAVLIGVVEEAERYLIIEQHLYPIVKVGHNDYIPLSYLEQAGVNPKEAEGIIYLQQTKERGIYKLTLNLKDTLAYMNEAPVYCGNVRSYVLKANEELLIPLEALKGIWEIESHEREYKAIEKISLNDAQLIEITETTIKNTSDHIMHISWLSLFWDGKNFIELPKTEVLLKPGESRRLEEPTDKGIIYVTTLLTSVNEQILDISDTFGQKDTSFFMHYTAVVRGKALNQLFPRYTIRAMMKYKIGDLEAKDKVELWRAEKSNYFVVKDKKGEKFQVPYNSIHIDGDWGTLSSKPSATDIEEFVTLNQLDSKTPYLIWTDVYRQRTYVLKKQEGQWHLEKSFVCSTGKNINPTPQGIYEVQYTIPYIGMGKSYRCKNALVFYRDYMFHSILFDKTGRYIKSGKYELGQKASHGCVRLLEEDSAWLYQHIPVGSTVWIR